MNILFIPGNSQSTDTFSEQLNSSKLKEHQISVFDLEAAINSLSSPKAETFFFALKDKLIDLHRKKHFDCIIGHSWGGHLLIESIADMKGVKGIMTIGTPFMSKPPRMEESFLPNPAIPLFYTKELNHEQLIQLADACLYNKKWVNYIANGMSKSSGTIRELTPAAIGTGSYNNEVKVVEQLNIPLAIIHGEKDKMVNINYYNSLNIPTLWQNKVHIISKSAHFPQLENADDFNQILTQFIANF
jgi:pimeloyl-ACP methyl ester carboxylesterase